MCGIAGIIGKNCGEKDKIIKKMTDLMIHRGPDDKGFYCDSDVALGMRRLSIIDLEKGKQPIFSEDGNLLIILNGEIYNFKELRQSLLAKGHKFKTDSDTEVIIHLYEEEGENCLNKLRGMFAFCIYDIKKKILFLARDYFGIKPLYFLNKNNIFAFASEIKSLLFHPYYNLQVNNEAVYYFLSFQYVPTQETIFKDIFRLLPGTYLKIDIENKKIEEKKYWNFFFEQRNSNNEENAKKELLNALEDSVRHHIISDVPVGAFLSGGIDSTAITALMKRSLVSKQISTFTVGFKEINEFNEAEKAAEFLKTDHTEIKISSSEFFEKIPELVWHFDEPIADPSAIAIYFVAREARKKVKVVLSGEGADELFGGYNIYLEPFALKKSDFLPRFIKKNLVKSNFNFFGKNYLRRSLTSLEDRYIGNSYIFKTKEIEKIWQGEKFLEQKNLVEKYYNETKNLSDSTRMQYIDINFWLPGDILAKADKMTMANSLELRVPFLDIETTKIASRIPDELKFKKGTKYLLREAMKGIIPEINRKREKLGFPVPIKEWIKKDSGLLKKIKKNNYIKEYFKIEEIEKINEPRKIYLLFILSIWYNVFICKKS